MIRIDVVDAETIRPIRHAVLRPGRPYEETRFALDELDDAYHAGAFREERLVGIISLYPESRDGSLRQGDWRIRGMAVLPEEQGKGLGARLLEAAVEHARSHGARSVWCNARTSALGFYERAGFSVEGDEFDIPGIGPHYVLKRSLGRV